MSTPNRQLLFALIYHTHHSLHGEDLPFWLELAVKSRAPLLELGCGSGRVLLALAEAGHHVVGIDRDRSMLEILWSRLTVETRSRVQVLQADFTAMPFSTHFDLIFMPCNTYSTLDKRARLAVIEGSKRYLSPRGRFAVSMPNPHLLKRQPARARAEKEEVFTNPVDGGSVQVSSAWRRQGNTFTVFWYYDHLAPDGDVVRFTRAVRHHLIPAQAYLDEMLGAGLRIVKIWGDFDGTDYTPESPFLIIAACV